MTRKWLDVASYLHTDAIEQRKERIVDAQERDAERWTHGICSVDLKTGWSGSAAEITMVVNRGLQSEMTLKLSREQTAALRPILTFEARCAVEEHTRRIPPAASSYNLWRCPDCGLGPLGPHALAAKVVAMMEAAPTLDAVYAAYDKHIVPVFDDLQSAPGDPIRPVINTIGKRRGDFGADGGQSKID